MNGLKRAENIAWAALGALVVVGAILLTGGFLYKFTGFWAGAMLALGQALVVGLAAWGLMLARQTAELGDPGLKPARAKADDIPVSSFRMMSDEAPAAATAGAGDVRTLDTGFQRLVVGLSGAVLAGLGAFAAVLIYWVYRWSTANPDLPVPIVGTFKDPVATNAAAVRGLDELGLVMGLGAAAIYIVFWRLTRVKRDTEGYGEAVASGFTLGVIGMSALAVATVLAWFRVSWASEMAAGVIAAMLLLQGLELLVNSMRTYSSIEEFDQEAVDLQALPLVPMLGSVWLGGLKLLFAQSVGLTGKQEAGVFARMMPRALLAMLVIAVGVSCLRVVPPGEVAIQERLGWVPLVDGRVADSAILKPGLHVTLPWPIDDLVPVPTDNLQLTDVGAELHAPKEWKNVDFQFWTFRAPKQEGEESVDEFITGEREMLETYVQVRWRVSDPALFYTALSHSEFFEKTGEEETRALPIYEAIIQQCTTFAVTRSFAMHSLEDLLIRNRGETENHTRRILQEKLDAIRSGIEVVNLTIKDLHPPYWRGERLDPTAQEIAGVRAQRGPASAFEFVVNARQYWEMQINIAESEKQARMSRAQGDKAAAINTAQADKQNKIAAAVGTAGRLAAMFKNIPPERREFELGLLRQQLKYRAIGDVLNPADGNGPTKYVVDPKVQLTPWQTSDNPAGRPGP